MAEENDEEVVQVKKGKRTNPKTLKSDMKKKSIGIFVVIVVVILVAVVMTTPKEEKEEPPPAKITTDETQIGEKAWQARAQARTNEAQREAREAQERSRRLAESLEEQKQQSSQMAETLRDLNRKIERMGNRRGQRARDDRSRDTDDDRSASRSEDQAEESTSDQDKAGGATLPPPPPTPAYAASGEDKTPKRDDDGAGRGDYRADMPSRDEGEGDAGGARQAERKPVIFAPEVPEVESDEADPADYQKNEYAGYMPAGSFAEAVLLTGLDAAASEQTRANPQPVLLRIQGNALTPGDGEYDIGSCVAIGSGYGDISAERAYIRLSRISCMEPSNNRVLETQIQGYIADSDGFQGMRGKVVRRNGQLIAKSLLAGFAEGIGKVGEAASQAASQRITQPRNTTGQNIRNDINLDTGDLAKAGAFGGASNAAGQIANFYLKEAKNIFPVVSVPPGRKVTIVVTEGAALEWHSNKGRYVKKVEPK